MKIPGLIKMPNISAIKSKTQSTLQSTADGIMNNPDLDPDTVMGDITSQLGVDGYMEKIEQAKEYGSKAKEIVEFIKDPKGTIVDMVKEKVIETVKERPEVQELKQKAYDYAKSKVEALPQYQAAMSKLEEVKGNAMKEIPNTPEELTSIAENPEGFMKSLPGIAERVLGVDINQWMPKVKK